MNNRRLSSSCSTQRPHSSYSLGTAATTSENCVENRANKSSYSNFPNHTSAQSQQIEPHANSSNQARAANEQLANKNNQLLLMKREHSVPIEIEFSNRFINAQNSQFKVQEKFGSWSMKSPNPADSVTKRPDESPISIGMRTMNEGFRDDHNVHLKSQIERALMRKDPFQFNMSLNAPIPTNHLKVDKPQPPQRNYELEHSAVLSKPPISLNVTYNYDTYENLGKTEPVPLSTSLQEVLKSTKSGMVTQENVYDLPAPPQEVLQSSHQHNYLQPNSVQQQQSSSKPNVCFNIPVIHQNTQVSAHCDVSVKKSQPPPVAPKPILKRFDSLNGRVDLNRSSFNDNQSHISNELSVILARQKKKIDDMTEEQSRNSQNTENNQKNVEHHLKTSNSFSTPMAKKPPPPPRTDKYHLSRRV